MIDWDIVQWGLIIISYFFNFFVWSSFTDLRRYVNKGEFVVHTVERINRVQLKK